MHEYDQLQGVLRTGAQFIETNEHQKRRNNAAGGYRRHFGVQQDAQVGLRMLK